MSDDPKKTASQSADCQRMARQRMEQVFDPAFLEPVEWSHSDPGFQNVQGDWHRIWSGIPGGHKKYSYFALYEKLFSHLRGTAPRILEIGVNLGASIRTWSEYLGDGAVICGIDTDERCTRFDAPGEGRHVRIGDQSDIAFLKAITEEFGPFDAIMDDGSHMTSHQIITFNALFLSALKPGGIYFIEDTNTSFWPAYRDSETDIFDLIQAASTATHSFYADNSYKDYNAADYPARFTRPRAEREIEEVRVFDSAVAIYRAGQDYAPPLVLKRK